MRTMEALWVLGLVSEKDLPNIAMEALERGVDNVPIRILAGLRETELDVANELFAEALKLENCGVLTKKEALEVYTTFISQQIILEEMEPYLGARKIWDAAITISDMQYHEVDTFIYAASEYESRPTDRQFFENEIKREAKDWVGKSVGDLT